MADFEVTRDFAVFDPLLRKRPELKIDELKYDLQRYYLPFIQRLVALKAGRKEGLIIGVSAIQGAGKTTQGEILETLLDYLGHQTISLSIDDHYVTHEQLNQIRERDPRFIRRGVTHDIALAIKNLTDLKYMEDGQEVKIPVYDKGAFDGDGDRTGWRSVVKKPDFIFYDGWMLGVRSVIDESVFELGLPALDTPEHIRFARDVNKKLNDYLPLWELLDFLSVLYVPNYEDSLKWRDQAEEALRNKGEGMSREEIREFVYYFWRSVHPAIQIKNLAHDIEHTDQVVLINDDHTVKDVLIPAEVQVEYP